jgi:hypothetical protein
MKTYWSGSVSVDGRVVSSSGDETLAKTIARLMSDCVYYQAVYPGSRIVMGDLREHCAQCHNDGKVAIHRPRSLVGAVSQLPRPWYVRHAR